MKRIAVLDRKRCIRDKCGYVCKNVCPPVRMGIDAIVIDDAGWPVIDENLCTGCGLCVKKCPVDAIKVINLAGESGMPIHQYGVNMFRLYNFALPKTGAVVALVGRNGIGKTTLLNILSRKLVPNMFDYSKQLTWDEVISKIRNRDLSNYFSQHKSSKFGYKIQNVEQLAKLAPGKSAGDLLDEFDENGMKPNVVQKFGLGKFIDSKLSSLSGGELQKLAISIVFLRDCDLYFFDEPSTYLDIYERMRVAREISSLSKDKMVMVVEHDLAILDYLSDYAYILYGVSGAYGVVSGIKHARTGINEFVDGYLKEENVRFRDYVLKFEAHSEQESKKDIFFEYGNMEKKYDRFTLKVDEGNVRKGEVIGIVGPNAIGKSTFIKLIAGTESPDVGDKLSEVKVSYKPQYINLGFEGTVGEYARIKNISQVCITEFELEHLMHKNVGNLSGGELQRVAVASAISEDADIYLLDEPSAFLDIEQRMRLSTILKRHVYDNDKSAFVVDHDVVFIDSISSRLIRISGNPSVEGHAYSPSEKEVSMNEFLKELDVTLRRDKDTGRPKINKKGSVLDREQRSRGEYYIY